MKNESKKRNCPAGVAPKLFKALQKAEDLLLDYEDEKCNCEDYKHGYFCEIHRVLHIIEDALGE